MKTKRCVEIEKDIEFVKGQMAYNVSMIALLMSEANLIDKEIEGLTASGLVLREKMRDLEAELKDTI